MPRAVTGVLRDWVPKDSSKSTVVTTLRGWLAKRNWKGVRAMPDSDDPKVLKARIRELEARLKRAEVERDILKKATAYFASPHLNDTSGSTHTKESSR